jgi:hypothetical protein
MTITVVNCYFLPVMRQQKKIKGILGKAPWQRITLDLSF